MVSLPRILRYYFMRRLFSLLFTLIISLTLFAQSRRAVELSTDVTMFVPSVAGAVVAIVEKDYEGMWQLVGSGATSIAAAYALKYTISKERPDGSDNHSFPSNHAGVAFAGATFCSSATAGNMLFPPILWVPIQRGAGSTPAVTMRGTCLRGQPSAPVAPSFLPPLLPASTMCRSCLLPRSGATRAFTSRQHSDPLLRNRNSL